MTSVSPSKPPSPASSSAGFPKSYSPAATEGEIRARWDKANAFHVDPNAPGEPFCVLIPPPNVTAALHLGHAFNNTLQDVLVRYHRMKGYKSLWMPGTDHAGISTQTVVEKRLLLQGKRRSDFSREEFIAKVQEWKDEYEATIIEQLKVMGCSCDFQRTRFTMDEVCARAVREAFFRLFKDGLIYRGKRLVNWDPVTQTALADDEVEMEEVQGHMWYLRYPLIPESGGRKAEGLPSLGFTESEFVTVATTRPETMLGDTAVAINPKDPRAASLVGRKVRLPIVNREIPIIADDYVVRPPQYGGDPNDSKAAFATGFLKVTPAHDPNDEQIWMRHKDEIPHGQINIFAPDATVSDKYGWTDISDEARQFIGLSREEARKKIVDWFKSHGLLEDVKPYTHSVGHSYRSHVPIEPYLSDQWYVAVTDDRMRGEALRAMARDQFESTSRDRQGAVAHEGDESQRLNGVAFFISFTTYASWLHGDDRGSVDREHNLPGTSVIHGDPERERREYDSLKQPPMHLEATHRNAVQDAIVEVCKHRGWRLIALHVRTQHVHCVVIADQSPERVMNDFKSYATRKLRERALVDQDRRVWTRHGSTRYLNDDAAVAQASKYVIEEQGSIIDPAPIDGRAHNPLPNGRGSFNRREGDGELRFFPARYAKTFQHWHENLRDWCISRQLWWGHRIPVWSTTVLGGFNSNFDDFLKQLQEWHKEGRIAIFARTATGYATFNPKSSEPYNSFFVCLRRSDDDEIVKVLQGRQFTQDPDVLDTWFSSGLWPLSTMGWPDPEAFPKEIPEGSALLNTFNPSTTLCTAREIITLWVSRMVMFNRYLRDGKLPFKNVYIHAMIQDGHGQKMSKSLGNGVDPRDIIHTHGADAMRFVLTQIATQTQDVRMPVDTMCPHCSHMFHPAEITTSAGYRVAAPEQTCPACRKHMVSGYGAASGLATPTPEKPLARNTSSKFDQGRNFANKLWNATGFALSNLAQSKAEGSPSLGVTDLSLIDRWMIARLHRTLHTVEDAINDYQFNAYADAMYDLVWRDFCDWYIEGIKPTIKSNPAQQQVLRTVLSAILRMLHPMMPFVTESLWSHFNTQGGGNLAGLDGINLPPNDLLATARWPDIKCSVEDKSAVAMFERVQSLIEAIRSIKTERNAQKKKIALFASAEVIQLISSAGGVVEHLAGLESVQPLPAKRPPGLVPLPFEGQELLLGGLAADLEAERNRLTKLIGEKEKAIAGFRSRLENAAYVSKAPPEKVQETREMLNQAMADLAAARNALQSLDA